MNKFDNHADVLISVSEAQDAETDIRERARASKHFITKHDGQWDAYGKSKLKDRFRGTFDLCTPIVDQISGEIDQSDFTIRVSPSGGESSKDTAKVLNGLIRNIRNISNAETVFQRAGRNNVISGFDCWEVVQDYIDSDSFDQDLFIKYVPNALDSVWFDPLSTEQDRSDATWGIKLVALSMTEYEHRFPEGKKQSIGDDKQEDAYYDKADSVIVGQLYYKKPIKIELVQMNDGSVYKVDDDFEALVDELAQQGIFETDRRKRNSWKVCSVMLDGGSFLNEPEDTVFEYIPLVPVYGNFDIVENKTIYFGKVEKLFDQQRVLNYALSRDIEDGALSAKAKYWATDEQIEGYEDDVQTLNTNNQALQRYNHVDGVLPPFVQGGVQVSQGLQVTVQNMQQMISGSANSFQAMQGNANPLQSGIAGGQQVEQGNIGSIKWFKPIEVAICHTGKILINAIPKVYDSTRQVRILEEDGTSSTVTLNQPKLDQQTGETITLNDLSIGQYDVVCDVGRAFNSQQKETANAFLEMASIDPSVAQNGMDIWLKNLNAPGMDLMAERYRERLINSNSIPETQLTDDERQAIQESQANQQQQEDPMMVAAKAEELKGQAAQMEAQNKQQQVQVDAQVKMAGIHVDQERINLEREKLNLDAQKFVKGQDDKFNVDAAKIQQGQQKLDMEAQKQMQDMALKLTELEGKMGQQLNSEVQSNMLTFDPSTGEFI